MALFNQIQSASFRGVKFLLINASTSGGRKTVTHEYPLTDRRFVEDLGKNQRIFTMQGVITGNRYLKDRESLQAALEQPGAGRLIHPFYGSVSVVSKGYTITEDLTKLGEATFNLTFERADLNIFPTESTNNASIINKQTNGIIAGAKSIFSATYNLTLNVLENFEQAVQKVNDMLDIFDGVLETINTISSKANDISGLIAATRRDINDLVNAPSNLATSISNMFVALDGLAQDPVAQFNLYTSFFSYGDNDVDIIDNTPRKTERKTNNEAFDDIVLVDTLSLSFKQILNLTFSNTSEIDEVRQQLDNQFNLITGGDEESTIDEESYENLYEQKTQVDLFLDSQELVTPKIIEIKTKEIPVTVLAYNYYGSTDNTETIIDLNDIINPSFIKGTVKVLTA